MSRKSLSTSSVAALVALGVAASPAPLAGQEAKIIAGLKQPESIALGPRGQVYVSETGEYETANDGYISILEAGQLRRFATGLDDPHGIKWWRNHLFVSDNMGLVWRIDAEGNAERFVDATDFPRKITNFNDIEIDSAGNIYLSDSGDWEGRGGVIFRITQDKKVSVVITDEDDWRLVSPNGLLMEGSKKLLVVDYTTGNLFRVDLMRRHVAISREDAGEDRGGLRRGGWAGAGREGTAHRHRLRGPPGVRFGQAGRCGRRRSPRRSR